MLESAEKQAVAGESIKFYQTAMSDEFTTKVDSTPDSAKKKAVATDTA